MQLTGHAKTHEASPQQAWVTTCGIAADQAASLNATGGSLR